MEFDIDKMSFSEVVKKREKLLRYSLPSTRRDAMLEACEARIKSLYVSTAIVEPSELHINDID